MATSTGVALSRYLRWTGIAGLSLSIIVPGALLALPSELLLLSGSHAMTAVWEGVALTLPLLLAWMWIGRRPGARGAYGMLREYRVLSVAFAGGWTLLIGACALTAALTRDIGARVVAQLLDPMVAWFGYPPSAITETTRYATELGVSGILLITTLFGLRLPRSARRIGIWWVVGGLIIIPIVVLYPFNHVADVADVEVVGRTLPAAAMLGLLLWALPTVLPFRAQTLRPKRDMTVGTAIAWALGLVSLVLVLLVGQYLAVSGATGLADTVLLERRARLSFFVLLALAAWFGSSQMAGFVNHLIDEMIADGLLGGYEPHEANKARNRRITITVFALLSISTLPINTLLVAAVLGLYLFTAILFATDGIRRLKSPLAPRLASLAAAAFSGYMTLALPSPRLTVLLVAIVSGAALYVLFARRGQLESQSDDLVLQDGAPSGSRSILVAVKSPEEADALLPVARKIAHARGIDMTVMTWWDETPDHSFARQRLAAKRRLEYFVEQFTDEDCRVVVRIAPDLAEAVLAAAEELDAELIIAPLIWAYDDDFDEIAELFERTGRELLIASGDFTQSDEVVLKAARHFDRDRVLKLAATVAGKIDLLGLPQDLEQWQPTVENRQLNVESVPRLRSEQTAKRAGDNILLMTAADDPFLRRSYYGGHPFKIARHREGPTLIYRPPERMSLYWLRRAWDALVSIVPRLEAQDRAEIGAQMRLSGKATRNFLVLMTLSSLIASGGLIQDSGAVVIGAMLIAPLMSPILGSSFAIVNGNSRLLRRALATVGKGAAIAIGVGTLFTMLLPYQEITSQVAARTQPNLVDLAVALAAGAAGVYSTAERSALAALPGVAIAVSLVPPLCAAGYGLGTGHFDVAVGASMLFLTNLASILLMGVFFFLLMGFRPRRDTSREAARSGVRWTIFALAALAVPLAFTTARTAVLARVEAEVALELRRFQRSDWLIRDVHAYRDSGQIVVRATAVLPEADRARHSRRIVKMLQKGVSQPVKVVLTSVSGQVETWDEDGNLEDVQGVRP